MCMYVHTHTHTHIHIYIYIYIYDSVNCPGITVTLRIRMLQVNGEKGALGRSVGRSVYGRRLSDPRLRVAMANGNLLNGLQYQVDHAR